MFSKLLKSARAYISDQPTNRTPQSSKKSPTNKRTMVTTRGRSAQNVAEEELTDENHNNVSVPASQERSVSKRKEKIEPIEISSDDDQEFLTPIAKKRKVLPVRGKSAKTPATIKNTRPVVELPAMIDKPDLDYVEEDEDDVESDGEGETEVQALPPTTPAKHQRFASEDQEEFFSTAQENHSPVKALVDAEIPMTDDEEEEEEEESDDEAPEALDMQEAGEAAKSKQRDAEEAVQKQLSATRKKRKEREANLKKQSEATKKRKVEPILDSEGVFPSAVAGITNLINEDANQTSEEADQSITLDHESPPIHRHALSVHRSSLLNYLPEEYLQDDDAPSQAIPLHSTSSKIQNLKAKSKKIKFHDLLEKHPKDKRVGSTTYRVTKAQSTVLAPKSVGRVRKIKEGWMQGRGAGVVGPDRRVAGTGFLRK